MSTCVFFFYMLLFSRLPGQYRNMCRARPADMKFMPLTMNTMMKTALEKTVSRTMNSKALLKKAK